MQVYFSPSVNAFYPKDYEKDYKSSGNWPNDLLEASYEDFDKFGLQTPPTGKVRSFNNGVFSWEDVILTENQSSYGELSWVSSELLRIREELEKVQDSDPNAVGTASDWRAYRKAVRAWQDSENFPNKNFRPKSPDFKE